MFEILGGVLGAGASLYGGILQAEAQDEANQINLYNNERNLQARERERSEQIAMAEKLRREQKLGSSDIRGTRVHYVEGKGWVTEGSPALLAMMKAQDAEQMKQLSIDAPMARKVRERNYSRGLQDEAMADTYRRQLGNTVTPSDDAYANDLYLAQVAGLREGSQDAGRRAFTQLFRTNDSSRAGDVAASLARENNSAYTKAALHAKLMARGSGQKEADTRRNQLANLYNLFATRAGQGTEANFKPTNIDNSAQLDSATKLDANIGQFTASSYGKPGGTLDYVQPNLGYGNAVSGAGSALASAFRSAGAAQAYRGGSGVQGFGSNSSAGGGDDYYTRNETGAYGT
jgi:hypothetical protein